MKIEMTMADKRLYTVCITGMFSCIAFFGVTGIHWADTIFSKLIILLVIAILFFGVIFAAIEMNLEITIDEKSNKLIIKRLLKSPVEVSGSEIISWYKKEINNNTVTKLYVFYQGTSIVVRDSLFDNVYMLEMFLKKNAAAKEGAKKIS